MVGWSADTVLVMDFPLLELFGRGMRDADSRQLFEFSATPACQTNVGENPIRAKYVYVHVDCRVNT